MYMYNTYKMLLAANNGECYFDLAASSAGSFLPARAVSSGRWSCSSVVTIADDGCLYTQVVTPSACSPEAS